MNALIYFLIWAVFIFFMMRLGCGAHVMGHGHRRTEHGDGDGGRRTSPGGLLWVPPPTDVDPVCRKTVDTDTAKSSVHDGSVYYFCSRDCREKFEAAPDQFVGSGSREPHPQLENSHV